MRVKMRGAEDKGAIQVKCGLVEPVDYFSHMNTYPILTQNIALSMV